MFSGSVLTGPFFSYYSEDPAWDKESEKFNWEQWRETQNEDFLPRVNGGEPTRFCCRRLTSQEISILNDIGGDGEESFNKLAWWCVALSLREIKPLVIDGKQEDSELPTVRDGRFKVMRLTDEWMDRIYNQDEDHKLFYQVAGRVLREVYGSPRK